jgi:hypothetical protein
MSDLIPLILDLDSQESEIYSFSEDEHCPICDEPLMINGRCRTCPECGWSGCEL